MPSFVVVVSSSMLLSVVLEIRVGGVKNFSIGTLQAKNTEELLVPAK